MRRALALQSILPDPEGLLILSPERLALALLALLRDPENEQYLSKYNTLHLDNIADGYPRQYKPNIMENLALAWNWLEREGLLVPKIGAREGWYRLSEKAKQLKTDEDLDNYIASSNLSGRPARTSTQSGRLEADPRSAVAWSSGQGSEAVGAVAGAIFTPGNQATETGTASGTKMSNGMSYLDWVAKVFIRLVETYDKAPSTYVYGLLIDDVAEAVELNVDAQTEIAGQIREAIGDALSDLERLGLVAQRGPGQPHYAPTQKGRRISRAEGGLASLWVEMGEEELDIPQEEYLVALVDLGQEEYGEYARLRPVEMDEICRKLGGEWTTYDGETRAWRIEQELQDTSVGFASAFGKDSKPTYKGIVWVNYHSHAWMRNWVVVGGAATQAGGQGTVTKVRQRADNTLGALKELHSAHLKNRERRQRMRREVEALQRVAGEGVTAVLDSNIEQADNPHVRLYVVAEWIEGPTLERYVGNKPRTVEEAIDITRALATIVGRCHGQDVYHRDVKPENIIIDPKTQQPTLVDFGIAWAKDDEQGLKTQAGQELGNRFLRLPELLAGRDKRDPRSDVTFVVGILFYLLSGRYPRTLLDENGRPPQIALADYFPSAIKADPRWSQLNSIFQKGFQQALDDRFQSIDELIAHLDAVTDANPLSDPPSQIPEQAVLDIKSSGTDQLVDEWQGAPISVKVLPGHDRGVSGLAALPDGRHFLSGGGNWKLSLWNTTAEQPIRTISDYSGLSAVITTPDGVHALAGTHNGGLGIWHIVSGRRARTFVNERMSQFRSLYAVAVTPDGNYVLLGFNDGSIETWHFESGEEVRVKDAHQGYVTSLTVLPDSQTFLSGSDDGTLKLWDLATGSELRSLTGHMSGVLSVAVTPDGSKVISGSHDETARVWELATGRELYTLTGHAGAVMAVAAAPSGRCVLSGAEDGTIRIWDLASGIELRTLTGHSSGRFGGVDTLIVLSNGRTIVSGGGDWSGNNLRVWSLPPKLL